MPHPDTFLPFPGMLIPLLPRPCSDREGIFPNIQATLNVGRS